MLNCGLDIGSVQAKGIILEGEKPIAQKMMPTGANSPQVALELYKSLLDEAGVSQQQIAAIVVTGYGRVSFPLATRKFTEITCHARGIANFFPEVRTLIDLGGQDSKAISLERGRVLDFVMNDKCAAGTGRFLEVMAQIFQLTPFELGNLALKAKREIPISSTCTVFAESEVVGLIARGLKREEIARGIITSVAQRIMALVQRLSLEEPVALSGGVAKNPGVKEILARELRIKLLIPPDPQFIGAWGAALLASDYVSAPSK